ncbi:hypothetical protein L484_022725 [Morus notabilis]|uniref:Uncharacterized protein n=1 Tax=Morus notabilis TaxID=981085 RepID=W9SK66_9ROSA|nr:hypothetical protein L484_022725 [Morus notabilis]
MASTMNGTTTQIYFDEMDKAQRLQNRRKLDAHNGDKEVQRPPPNTLPKTNLFQPNKQALH